MIGGSNVLNSVHATKTQGVTEHAEPKVSQFQREPYQLFLSRCHLQATKMQGGAEQQHVVLALQEELKVSYVNPYS